MKEREQLKRKRDINTFTNSSGIEFPSKLDTHFRDLEGMND